MAFPQAIVVRTKREDMNVDVAQDLLPIAPTAGAALFLIARPGIPSRDLAEFLARARANPGKLNYGSAGNGTLQHVAIEMLVAERSSRRCTCRTRARRPCSWICSAGRWISRSTSAPRFHT
jgi:tripartite-type tricarboxylate transporter receptor subunit TctC